MGIPIGNTRDQLPLSRLQPNLSQLGTFLYNDLVTGIPTDSLALLQITSNVPNLTVSAVTQLFQVSAQLTGIDNTLNRGSKQNETIVSAQTADATPIVLFQSSPLNSNLSTTSITFDLSVGNLSTPGDGCTFVGNFKAYSPTFGSIPVVSAITFMSQIVDVGMIGVAVTATAILNQIQITITGLAGQTIAWNGLVKMQVSFW